MTTRDLALRRRCEQLVAGLDLPGRFGVDALLSRVAERRQRPLRLLPLLPGLRDDPSGMWVPLPQEDVVFAESSVSGWYRDHVVLHEVGHMLWEHVGTIADVTSWLGQYGVAAPTGTQVQMRCSVTARHKEREAEMVALLLETRIDRQPAATPPDTTPADVAAVLHRLAVALGAGAPARALKPPAPTAVRPDGQAE